MSERLLLAVVVVAGVPAVLWGYITLTEAGLRRLSPRRQAAFRPWLWLAPALALLLIFLIYPMLNTIWISFKDARSEEWVGLENYRRVFTDDVMRTSLRNNALWLVLFTLITVGFGLLIAILADRVRYESAVKAVIFMPMAISLVAAGVIWKFMYDFRPPGAEQTGTVNAVLTTVSGADPRAWLINSPSNNVALIIAAAWVWTGFCMVVLSAALKGIPTEVLEAARIDGANEWQMFRRIVLPLLSPTIVVVGTIMVITALKAFDIVYAMTNGNYDTDVIATRMYKEMFTVRHFGRASAVAVVLLIAVIPVLIFNMRRMRAEEATV